MTNDDIRRFFHNTPVSIHNNLHLREPQVFGYQAIVNHLSESREMSYVQLPVGCGKSGLMGLTPFGVTNGRVLIVAPNTTVRDTILSELDISKPECFYSKRAVLKPANGPYVTVLKPDANVHDCDNAHIVVANIQQFVGEGNRWYEQLPQDYFQMVLIDEGHHNVAESWRRLLVYFKDAAVISFTATPMRSDGQQVEGKKLYSFTYTRAMMMGFISPIDAVYVSPAVVTFTAKGEKKTIPLDKVIKMREHDWFSKGIALSEECNRHIVQASIKQLTDVRRHGTPRQIIASACSIRHAVQIKALYHEYGLEAEVLHSKLRPEERKRVEAALRQGLADAVVQVQMLGEGYDLPTLSVAAVFRPYRSLSPYIQFVGRILRLANPQAQASLANKVYVVSHLGLNDERWWNDFRNFDKEDQELFRECLDSSPVSIDPSDATPRLSLRPFMRVLDETVDKYLQQAYLKKVDENMVADFMATIREKGYDPSEFGLTEDMVKRRLDAAAAQAREVQPLELPVQPQRRREALRTNIYQDARSIASTVIDRLGLKHAGADLLPHYPGRGSNNLAILITLALRSQNETMGIEAKERDSASIEQLGLAHDATANIADSLTSALRMKMGGKGNVT